MSFKQTVIQYVVKVIHDLGENLKYAESVAKSGKYYTAKQANDYINVILNNIK